VLLQFILFFYYKEGRSPVLLQFRLSITQQLLNRFCKDKINFIYKYIVRSSHLLWDTQQTHSCSSLDIELCPKWSYSGDMIASVQRILNKFWYYIRIWIRSNLTYTRPTYKVKTIFIYKHSQILYHSNPISFANQNI